MTLIDLPARRALRTPGIGLREFFGADAGGGMAGGEFAEGGGLVRKVAETLLGVGTAGVEAAAGGQVGGVDRPQNAAGDGGLAGAESGGGDEVAAKHPAAAGRPVSTAIAMNGGMCSRGATNHFW